MIDENFTWKTGDKFKYNDRYIVAGRIEVMVDGGLKYMYYYLDGKTYRCPADDFINVLRSFGSNI